MEGFCGVISCVIASIEKQNLRIIITFRMSPGLPTVHTCTSFQIKLVMNNYYVYETSGLSVMYVLCNELLTEDGDTNKLSVYNN